MSEQTREGGIDCRLEKGGGGQGRTRSTPTVLYFFLFFFSFFSQRLSSVFCDLSAPYQHPQLSRAACNTPAPGDTQLGSEPDPWPRLDPLSQESSVMQRTSSHALLERRLSSSPTFLSSSLPNPQDLFSLISPFRLPCSPLPTLASSDGQLRFQGRRMPCLALGRLLSLSRRGRPRRTSQVSSAAFSRRLPPPFGDVGPAGVQYDLDSGGTFVEGGDGEPGWTEVVHAGWTPRPEDRRRKPWGRRLHSSSSSSNMWAKPRTATRDDARRRAYE